MGNYDEQRYEDDKLYYQSRELDIQKHVNRLMDLIGTSDPTIRKVVEVLYKELK